MTIIWIAAALVALAIAYFIYEMIKWAREEPEWIKPDGVPDHPDFKHLWRKVERPPLRELFRRRPTRD